MGKKTPSTNPLEQTDTRLPQTIPKILRPFHKRQLIIRVHTYISNLFILMKELHMHATHDMLNNEDDAVHRSLDGTMRFFDAIRDVWKSMGKAYEPHIFKINSMILAYGQHNKLNPNLLPSNNELRNLALRFFPRELMTEEPTFTLNDTDEIYKRHDDGVTKFFSYLHILVNFLKELEYGTYILLRCTGVKNYELVKQLAQQNFKFSHYLFESVFPAFNKLKDRSLATSLIQIRRQLLVYHRMNPTGGSRPRWPFQEETWSPENPTRGRLIESPPKSGFESHQEQECKTEQLTKRREERKVAKNMA